ncbi:MAG: hypothetical protein U0230_22010 [Polyangiales bacterium]
MRTSLALLLFLLPCNVAVPPEARPAVDAGVLPGTPPTDALADRVCFALASRCDRACADSTYASLESLDGRLGADELASLDACFEHGTCAGFDVCVSTWLRDR